MIYFTKMTSIGKLTIIEKDGFIVRVSFGTYLVIGKKRESALIASAFEQIEEYLQQKRTEFDLPIMLEGTEFQLKVWNLLREIPYGKTCSYKDIAKKLGNFSCCRAIGVANNKNPIPIIVPCHRVIGADGNLTGYAGGLRLKRQLLLLEQRI